MAYFGSYRILIAVVSIVHLMTISTLFYARLSRLAQGIQRPAVCLIPCLVLQVIGAFALLLRQERTSSCSEALHPILLSDLSHVLEEGLVVHAAVHLAGSSGKGGSFRRESAINHGDLLDTYALVEQVDVRLSQPELLVLLPDQRGHIEMCLVVHITAFFIIALPPAHDTADRRYPFDLVLPLLAAVLVAHCFG